MRKQWTNWILLVLALTAGAALILFLNREPRADGQRLSYWLRTGCDQSITIGRSPGPHHDVEAEDAIRKIGPQAVPILLRKLDSTEPAWRLPIALWLIDRLHVSLGPSRAVSDWNEAQYGFGVLGTQAVTAIPELARMLYQTNKTFLAAYSLAHIGPEATPVVRAALTNANGDICLAALNASIWSQEIGRAVLPEMTALLSSPNPRVAQYAASRLENFLPLEEFLGVVTNFSGPNRLMVDRLTLQRLFAGKTNRVIAVPYVLPLLDSPDARLRQQATNLLREIAPATAFAHGIATNPPPGNPRVGRGPGTRPAAGAGIK